MLCYKSHAISSFSYRHPEGIIERIMSHLRYDVLPQASFDHLEHRQFGSREKRQLPVRPCLQLSRQCQHLRGYLPFLRTGRVPAGYHLQYQYGHQPTLAYLHEIDNFETRLTSGGRSSMGSSGTGTANMVADTILSSENRIASIALGVNSSS